MIIEPAKYGFIRVASCSPELKVADIEFNVNEIAGLIDKACREKVSVIVFPELSVTGYTCGDLFYQESILPARLRLCPGRHEEYRPAAG